MSLILETRKFTADEYLQMAEAGVLLEYERIELIHGEILPMAPSGDRHAASVDRITEHFVKRFGDDAIVRIQSSFKLVTDSMPEPDVLVLKPRADYYEFGGVHPEDVLLIGEVSDSSLTYDRRVKLPLYATHGLPEFWLFNLIDRQIEVYRQPAGDSYHRIETYRGDDIVRSLAFPDRQFKVTELIGG